MVETQQMSCVSVEGNISVDATMQKSGVTLFYEGVSPHKLTLMWGLVYEV